MRRTDVDAIEAQHVRGVERRDVSAAVATDEVTLNQYVVSSGTRISGLHAHVDQEEVFVVLDGEVAIETLEGTVAVEAGETVRVPPGEFQSVTNPFEASATVLALGAPRETSELRVPVGCPTCGHGVADLEFTADGTLLVCSACGNERDSACPDCSGELRAVLGGDDRPVSVCRACGARMTER